MFIHSHGNVLSKSALVLLAGLAIGACGSSSSDDDNESPAASPTPAASPAPSPATSNSTDTFNSQEGGKVATSGGQSLVVVPGAVPNDGSGQPADVTFSVEADATPPQAFPGNVDMAGGVTKYGPDGFDFAWPLTTTLPLPSSATDLTGLQYMRYDAGSSSWVPYPGMALVADENGNVNGVSVPSYDLGYDALGFLNTEPGKSATGAPRKLLQECTTCDGAMRWSTDRCQSGASAECHTYFVAKSYTPNQPWQKSTFQSFINRWYNRGSGCAWVEATQRFEGSNCGVWSTGSSPAGDPAAQTIFHILQGNWEFCVTESQYVTPGGSLPVPGKWTYDQLVPVSINQASHNSCQTFDCWSNVVNINLPSNGSWKEPADMPACPTNSTPSTPVGTGQFQATLTWINNTQKTADVDFHLYGPDGVHVYYGAPNSPNDSLELDRDWRSESGNAVENIFSTGRANIPSGEYRLTVVHFSGDTPISFNVRVVQSGVSSTYSNTLTSNDQEIEILRFTQ